MILFSVPRAHAQSLLNKTITLSVKEKRLTDVLAEISKKGGFYFSYNGKLIPRDSLVTIDARDRPVREILGRLFQNRYELEERNNYVIITAALPHLSLINPDLTAEDNSYSVSGIIIDERTGERLMNVSVYEKNLLRATLTDEHGYFRIKFKAETSGQLSLTASKLLYRDTTINFLHPVKVSGRAASSAYANSRGKGNRVERTGFGRLFISARQKIQSMNIPDFFATRPFQASLTPGLSSHGMFSSQVVNKFSLNLAGGYTAGTNGVEFGGLFNINKGDSKYLQMAGIFNLAGGNVTGLQLAGAHNHALDTVKGAQVSLFINKAGGQVSGAQISAFHNETHHLKGLQIGLVNVADTSEGASIGIVNIIRNGFYKVAYSASDIAGTNLTLKTGTHAFYSALMFSANPSAQDKIYAFGLGIGHDFMFSNSVYLSAEAGYKFANTGLWDDRWAQGKLLLNIQLAKNVSLFGGATYNQYWYNGSQAGYQTRFRLPQDAYYRGYINPVKKWGGWEAGIAFNSVFKPAKKITDDSQRWYLGFAATAGIGWDQPYTFVSGGELSLERDLGDNLKGTLTTGYTHIGVEPGSIVTQINNTILYSKPVNIIPLKAGIRLKAGKLFYFGGEIGEAFGTETDIVASQTYLGYQNTPYRSLMYAVSAGLSFKNGLETGIKFEDYGLQSQYKQLALRLGYRIRLSK